MSEVPLQASTRFYPHFTLPWVRSSGFGSSPCDSSPFQSPRLIACAHVAFATAASFRVSLATKRNSLAHYSQRTLEHRSALAIYVYSVSGSFHSLSRVLCNFPSRYSYAIGLETYLGLEVDASRLHTPFPRSTTLDTASSLSVTNTGLSPSLARLFRRLLVPKRD